MRGVRSGVEMVGRSGGALGGRERIVIVNELLPNRLKRAARRHLLRAPQRWRPLVVIAGSLATVGILKAVTAGDPQLLLVAALSLPVLLAYGFVGGTVSASALGRDIDREFVPGRLIGFSVGSHTIRYRDHDSCVEYAYSCVRGVRTVRDVVVVDLGFTFWALPIELFDGVSLEVLRTRAGRPTLPGDV